jgi:hypothetical protein
LGFALSSLSNYSLNAAHHGTWVVTLGNNGGTAHGALNNTGSNETRIYYNTPNFVGDCNVGAGITFAATTGHLSYSRTTSTLGTLYTNGTAGNTDTGTTVSVSIETMFALARNRATGNTEGYGTHQIAASHFGGALTATDSANLYSRIRTYMTNVGVP